MSRWRMRASPQRPNRADQAEPWRSRGVTVLALQGSANLRPGRERPPGRFCVRDIWEQRAVDVVDVQKVHMHSSSTLISIGSNLLTLHWPQIPF